MTDPSIDLSFENPLLERSPRSHARIAPEHQQAGLRQAMLELREIRFNLKNQGSQVSCPVDEGGPAVARGAVQ